MTLTIELTPEQEARLQAAAASGSDPETVLRKFVEGLPAPQTWGARVIQKWRQAGVLGAYGDMSRDSPEVARELRAKVDADLFHRDTDAA